MTQIPNSSQDVLAYGMISKTTLNYVSIPYQRNLSKTSKHWGSFLSNCTCTRVEIWWWHMLCGFICKTPSEVLQYTNCFVFLWSYNRSINSAFSTSPLGQIFLHDILRSSTVLPSTRSETILNRDRIHWTINLRQENFAVNRLLNFANWLTQVIFCTISIRIYDNY